MSASSSSACPGSSANKPGSESGLGAPADIDTLDSKITQLEQQAADLRIQLSERDDELAAARAANRELMTRINHNPRTR